MEEAARTVTVHADVTHDVGLVADVVGTEPGKTQDLRKALGTALTLARLQAEARGQKEAAEVLGFAHVASATRDATDFRLEAGLPFEFLERQLKSCIEAKHRKAAERKVSEQERRDGG